LQKKLSKKIIILVGIIIVGIAISFGFNSDNQEPTMLQDPRTVDWRHVHGVGIDPVDSGILYIATHGDFYQSRNGAPPVKVDKVRADYMAFNAPPTKDSPLYASGHPSSGGNTGLIKSSDGGVTWQQVAKVIEPPVDFHAMAVTKSNPDMILGFDSSGRGLFQTTDAGKTWSSIEYPEYISALAISPNDSQLIFAGTGKGIFKSSDGGKTWVHLKTYDGVTMYALAFDDEDTLFASAGNFGLVKSSDLGESWEDLQDIDLTITSIATDSQNKVIYVGGYSSGGFQEVYKLPYGVDSYEIIGTNKGLK
jgi:photosystem II stability/assembly factor-like uncharacterized protein